MACGKQEDINTLPLDPRDSHSKQLLRERESPAPQTRVTKPRASGPADQGLPPEHVQSIVHQEQ